ncbi:MAG: NTP transferase domain-containing protein, partial [Roseovarius sp.]|nr:NTP transferase domain-containing protein [Roseovarius sp.]
MTDFASVILAGERDSRDALRDETGVACKALLDIGGTPMIRRVIDALRSAQSIGAIHLSGPNEACVQSDAGLAGLVARKEVHWVPSGPS